MQRTLPPIETAYRDWLSQYHQLYDQMKRLVPSYLREIGLRALPPQVTVPGAMPWSAGVNVGAPDPFWLGFLFFPAYEQTRHTYHVDGALWDTLERCRWPSETPAEALKYLPLPAFALHFPPETLPTLADAPGGPTLAACYDLLSGEEGTGELELRIMHLSGRNLYPFTVIHLRGTMDEAVERAAETIIRSGDADRLFEVGPNGKAISAGDLSAFLRRNAEHVVNVLLYLAGNDDVVSRVGHYPQKLFKRHRRALKGTAHEGVAAREPSEADVGVEIRRALVRHMESATSSGTAMEQEGVTRSLPPHIRSPHPHLYWTGPGRKVPKVYYLPPIPVKGGGGKKPSIQSVK